MDVWLESLTGSDEKTKFRTRLEKGSQANSTEIFISHRNREGLIQNAWKQSIVLRKIHMYPKEFINPRI